MQVVTGIVVMAVVALTCYAVLYAHKTSRANMYLQIAIWAKSKHEAELFRQLRKKELTAEWAH
jgi:hypothetical protein